MIRKNLGLLSIVALFTFSVVYVYAYEETIQLPSSDYHDKNCYAVIWNTDDWEFTCTYGYGNGTIIVLPRGGTIIQADPEADNPYEDVLKKVELYFEEQIKLDGQDEVIPTIEDESPRPLETVDPEVRRALDKLGICQFGEGVWAGIVANYTREVPDELPIFTSGLDKERILGQLARHFEECKGMTQYPWLSVAYENKYLADALGLDQYGRPEINTRGNEPSLMFEITKAVTDEDKADEADKWETWMCADENLHLGLCGHEFSGTNRGGFTGGMDCQIHGQPATEGGTPAQERCPLRELEAYDRTEVTSAEINERVQEALCDSYSIRYDSFGEDKRPDWISHCYDE